MEDINNKIKQNLIDAGCDSNTITDFFNLQGPDSTCKQLKLLQIHRRKLLLGLHKYQREIDCLDYLVTQIKNNKYDGLILFDSGGK